MKMFAIKADRVDKTLPHFPADKYCLECLQFIKHINCKSPAGGSMLGYVEDPN